MRNNNAIIISKEAQENIKRGVCAICGEPKRRKDWYCCSKKCTRIFQENHVIYGWNSFRSKIFRRDLFICKRCGFESRKVTISHPDELKWYHRNYIIFKTIKIEENEVHILIGDDGRLIADHIIPIALGGEQWEEDNIQTLCIKCNKKKTIKDLKKINIERKISVSQKRLP